MSARTRRIGPLSIRTLVEGADGSPFSVHSIRMAPGATHAALHHRKTSEFFIVQEGALHAVIGGRRRRFGVGGSCFLPPGTAHAFRAGRTGVRVLALFCPPLDLDRPDVVFVDPGR